MHVPKIDLTYMKLVTGARLIFTEPTDNRQHNNKMLSLVTIRNSLDVYQVIETKINDTMDYITSSYTVISMNESKQAL